MKLIVGLGNPGREYSDTRHNIGFLILAELAARHAVSQVPKAKFHGEVLDVVIRGARAILLCPTTYMNRSGLAVMEASQFYKLPPESILVVCDDLNLPPMRIRFRVDGTAGGQKGLNDILRVLGTNEIPRLRVGIGRPPSRMDAADYVLAPFLREEREVLTSTIKHAGDAVELWLASGAAAVMDRYNGDDGNS